MNDKDKIYEWFSKMLERSDLSEKHQEFLKSSAKMMIESGSLRGDLSEWLVREVHEAREIFDDLYL